MKKILAVAALLATAVAPAFAQGVKSYYGAVDFGSLSYPGSPNAVTVSGGYRVVPNWAAEAGYALIGDSTTNTGFGTISVRQSLLSLVAVYTHPLEKNFSVFGKAGLGINNYSVSGTGAFAGTSSSSTSINPIFGAGGQYDINRQVGVRAQYEILGSANSSSLSRVSIGATYNF